MLFDFGVLVSELVRSRAPRRVQRESRRRARGARAEVCASGSATRAPSRRPLPSSRARRGLRQRTRAAGGSASVGRRSTTARAVVRGDLRRPKPLIRRRTSVPSLRPTIASSTLATALPLPSSALRTRSVLSSCLPAPGQKPARRRTAWPTPLASRFMRRDVQALAPSQPRRRLRGAERVHRDDPSLHITGRGGCVDASIADDLVGPASRLEEPDASAASSSSRSSAPGRPLLGGGVSDRQGHCCDHPLGRFARAEEHLRSSPATRIVAFRHGAGPRARRGFIVATRSRTETAPFRAFELFPARPTRCLRRAAVRAKISSRARHNQSHCACIPPPDRLLGPAQRAH